MVCTAWGNLFMLEEEKRPKCTAAKQDFLCQRYPLSHDVVWLERDPTIPECSAHGSASLASQHKCIESALSTS